VKRFYIVENFSTNTIRAWHGHLKEAKIVYPLQGSAIVAAVAMTNPRRPSKKTRPERFVLSAKEPAALYIPAGYANGFKSLAEGTSLIFLSTATLAESQADDHRFPWDYWGGQVWEVANR
jgi:dTDP-4-dehydrorhamnose 3,5-epimerase